MTEQGQRLASHGLAVAALLALAFFVHRDDILAPGTHFDERIFAGAFDAVRHGQSPYTQPTFNYPPPFAVLGAALWQRLGERSFLLLLRGLELASACAIAWLAVAFTPWRPWLQWTIAAAMVTLAFPVENAVACGNISPIIQVLALAGLVLASTTPFLAGILLGTGIALKPLAAAAVPLLAVYGWKRRDGFLRAALVAGVTAAGLLAALGGRYLPALWSRATVPAPPAQDLSLARVLRGFGLHVNPLAIFAAVTVLAAIYLLAWRAHRPSERDMQAVVLTACAVGLPVVWPHTLLMTLPVQVHALERVLDERQRPTGWKVLLILLLAAAMLGIDGSSGSRTAPLGWPEAAQGALALVPLAGVLILCGVAVTRRARASPRSGSSASPQPSP